MTRVSKFFLAALFVFAMPSTTSAQVFVGGGGAAHQCYLSAKLGNSGRIGAIRKCEEALDNININHKNKAATHTNLGVLLMRKGENEKAQTHYKHAIKLRPKTAETYINYGASLIYTGEYQDAITALNKAIDFGTEKMPEALFNRAMAYDRQQNYKSAYKDLKQALVLRPEWPIAQRAIENYTVTSSPKTN